MLHQLVYVSSAVSPFSATELVDLLRRSRTNNACLDLTGLLLYQAGNFMQVLEREEANVDQPDVPRTPLAGPAAVARLQAERGVLLTAARVAAVNRARSPGANSTCNPRRPALTYTLSNVSILASITTGSRLRPPSGLMPPTT